MGQAQRDSPEEPCTRASRSPEGEVCLFRDFPRGNQREGFWLLQARTCLLLFSGPGLWLCPPTHPFSASPFMACSGLQAHQTARISLISCLRLAFTLHTWNFQSLELSVLPDCRPPTGSSKLSSNVMAVFFDLSKESESPLPLGSVPPPPFPFTF